jgi:hypothetical protein
LKKWSLEQFRGGWIVGDFLPSVEKTGLFEFGVKRFLAGDIEPAHYQKVAQEITVVISGKVRIGELEFVPGDVCQIFPGEVADFEALESGSLAVIKFPSDPSDKEIV